MPREKTNRPARGIKREDRLLLSGSGQFADDVPLNNPLFVAFHRSQTRGKIDAVDVEEAKAVAGVFAVHVAKDVEHLGALAVNAVLPLTHLPEFTILAAHQSLAAGQPVVGVLAETSAQAQDGADHCIVDETEALHETRVIAEQRWQAGDTAPSLKEARHAVEATLRHPRLAPSPMEPRTIVIAYDSEGDCVTIWHSTQTPHRTRSEIAKILHIDASRIRVIARHVGGAFGQKASIYPEEVFAVWAAFHHKRDVKWTATRSDDFLSATHGRGLVTNGQLAIDKHGTFTALMANVSAPIGPWLPNSALIPAWNAGRILPSGYRVPALDIHTQAVTDGRGLAGIYRGAGRPEANALMERLIDKAARHAGLGPFEIRRRNFLKADEFPHETVTGNTLDSGDYAQVLNTLEAKSGYSDLIATCARRRANGELVGIGVAFCLEPSGEGWETATVTLTETGAHVASGSSSQGHGRETAFAQIAAQGLGLAPEQITVAFADTQTTPTGIGAVASRSTAIGGSAVLQACQQIITQRDTGTPLPITVESKYENEGQAWGYGAYLAAVAICKDTGDLTIEQITCVDDAGHIVNPDLVHGQILGGIAQGIGEATMEHIEYDADGQLLTGSLMDYALPRASDIPPVSIHTLETPSPMNILGAKGVGEAGTIGAPIAILNAAVDALAPLGITDLQMPLTSQSLWRAIQTAKGCAP